MNLTGDFGVTLVCPACRTEVARVAEAFICRSEDCRRSYPILDGIPKFLIDDAQVLSTAQWQSVVPENGDSGPRN